MTRERIVGPESAGDENEWNWGLRPRLLDEYIGQPETVERIKIAIEATKARGETLDHLLLHGPPGLGKCITADSTILTGEGLREFQQILPQNMPPESSQKTDVQVYGVKGLEEASHVYASGFVPTRRVKTRSGFSIEGTQRHPLLVATPQGPQWKPLSQIKAGDYVALARGTEVWGTAKECDFLGEKPPQIRGRNEALVSALHASLSNSLSRPPAFCELQEAYSATRHVGITPTPISIARRLALPLCDARSFQREATHFTPHENHSQFCKVPLNADFAYLIGAYIGDGHMEKSGNFPAFVITCGEAEMQNELQRIMLEIFGLEIPLRQYGDKAAHLRFSQNIGKVLLQCGVKAAGAFEKTVPDAILQGPRESALGFLQGLFDADGYALKDGVGFGTRSKQLAHQVQLLLLNFGFVAHQTEKQRHGAPFYSLFLGGRDALKFHQEIGFRLSRKRARGQLNCITGEGWQRGDLVPCADSLLRALIKKAQPLPRAVHKTFDHVKRGDRISTRRQIEKYLQLLPQSTKQEPEYKVLQALLNPRFFWDRIETIEEKAAEAFDFVVPGTHSFVANGFFNHNTTLGFIIAEELGRDISLTSGPALERPGDLMPFLINAKQGDIIFIDEIHRLPRVVEEFLYSAMEDWVVNFTLDKGLYSKPLPIRLERFTLIGATTRPAILTRPLRDRFGIQQHLDFYNENDLTTIAVRSAKILDTPIDPEGARELARRARGTPRIVNRLLRRVRDYAQVRGDGTIHQQSAKDALKLEGIDQLGLDRLDHAVLRVIKDVYNGGPVGKEALAATLNEETDTIEDVVEPYLLKIGFLARTPSGRRITRQAYEYLGETPPATAMQTQPSLWDEAKETEAKSKEKRKPTENR